MADKKPIDENALNELLRNLYLDEKNKTIDENEAQFVMEQEYSVNIDPEKEKQLLKKLQKRSGGFGGYKLYLSIFSILVITCFFIWYFFTEANTPLNNLLGSNKQNNKNEHVNNSDAENVNVKENSDVVANINSLSAPDTFGRVKIQKLPVANDSVTPSVEENKIQVKQKQENVVPYITEEDKARYTKLKNLILLKLYKSDKGLYTHVAADKMEYNKKTTIIEPFAIRNMSVTNLEYKTFLADLLIQKRKEDYLIAQVFSNNWETYHCPNLANIYFQDEQYNDFPVVNITIEGAKLFCKWLEEEIKLYAKQNNLKSKPITIRLPYDEEWLYVALAGYAKIPYEKGYNTIFDQEEGLVDKSFINRIELIKKRAKRSDTLYHLLAVNKYEWNEKSIIESFALAFKLFSVAPRDTIYADRMKAFGKTASVSQIVIEKKSALVWFIGITWKDKSEYLKMQNEFKSAQSSPFVGFRPVIINSDDSQYKNPFW